MKARYLIFAATVAAFSAIVWLMDPFLLFIYGVALLLWIGLPASLIAGLLLLVALRTGRSLRPALTILSIMVAFGCFLGLAIPTNDFIQQCSVAAAKEYPARVAPLLEAYRQAHGSYPISLSQLPTLPVVPRLLRSQYSYRSDGQHYTFTFSQPGGLIDVWDYDSKTHTWHLST